MKNLIKLIISILCISFILISCDEHALYLRNKVMTVKQIEVYALTHPYTATANHPKYIITVDCNVVINDRDDEEYYTLKFYSNHKYNLGDTILNIK